MASDPARALIREIDAVVLSLHLARAGRNLHDGERHPARITAQRQAAELYDRRGVPQAAGRPADGLGAAGRANDGDIAGTHSAPAVLLSDRVERTLEHLTN